MPVLGSRAFAWFAVASIACVAVACKKDKAGEPDAATPAEPRLEADATAGESRSTSSESAGALIAAAATKVPEKLRPRSPAEAGKTVDVPAGVLLSGTLPSDEGRDPGAPAGLSPFPLGAFTIDALPYPNDPSKPFATQLSRDDAQKACQDKGARLCTELEWERACKGPDNTTYEYGETYRSALCMTGQSAELASRKPCGERPSCRSGFGVLEMHGGAWEWTDSTWGRGTHDPNLAVLRGGNAEAGEIVGRCANAIGRPASKKHPTFGFRCCAGERNEAEVVLDPHTTGKTLTMLVKPEERAAKLVPLLDKGQWGSDVGQLEVDRAWLWQPVPNEDLVVFGGCTPEGISRKCGFVVGRTPEGGEARVVAQLAFPRAMPEMKTSGDPLRIRAIAVDIKGRYFIEFSYSYGKVSVGAPVRLSEGQGLDPKTPAP